MVAWTDADALADGPRQPMWRHEELGIAKGLHRANAHQDLFPRSFGSVQLPVEFVSHKRAGGELDAPPVRPETQQLEGVVKQTTQRALSVQAERVHLGRSEADAQPHVPARRNRQLLPLRGQRHGRACDAELRCQRERQPRGG